MPIFEKTQGEAIELKEAAAWTANYRKESEAKGAATVVRSHFFGSDILYKIMEQEGCAGIRMYYALDEAGTKQLVLVGVQEDGTVLQDGIVADRARVCPPNCGSGSELDG